ncbi:hypothetical protein GCK72_013803 [Caenorhabditis remanei]|uniref:Glycosyltransferase family 92 protein n=1 Tax=Caenorhabditis remanei TaxID=31234 RepID=A0A6A5GPG2_CAERE|nr:hypothetical protein GCK72_013803 [Caenorhabditis remanei]KAF1757348.1 hypothetical protein GCK72_013803 [Caenorhabditis remanei]
MEQSRLISVGETTQTENIFQRNDDHILMSSVKYVLVLVTFWIFIFTVGFLVGLKKDTSHLDVIPTLIHYDPHLNYENLSLPLCHIEHWNNKTTISFPFYDLYKYFAERKVTGSEGLSDGQLRLLTAFLYEEYIVITHTAQNPKGVGRVAYCHYYDCNRNELPGTRFESFVFPMTAVHCPRRAGVKYVSLSFENSDPPKEEPIPLLNRIFEYPPHEIGVCVGQIYGEEKKWLEIIEYVEHHKLMGATMFYFTILEMDEYSKRTIEDYQRLGEIEATFVNTEYEKINWLFHMIQVHECFFRSKFHSKWVIGIDIDERLVMTQMPLMSYLRQQSPDTCEINFGSRRIQKLYDDPEKYISTNQTRSSLSFYKYNQTTTHRWGAFKSIFKPAKVHAIHFHWTVQQHDGCRIKTAKRQEGYIRHYRTTDSSSLAGSWVSIFKPYTTTQMDSEFSKQLEVRVIKRVEYLYKLHPVFCETIDPKIRKHFPHDLHCVN